MFSYLVTNQSLASLSSALQLVVKYPISSLIVLLHAGKSSAAFGGLDCNHLRPDKDCRPSHHLSCPRQENGMVTAILLSPSGEWFGNSYFAVPVRWIVW